MDLPKSYLPRAFFGTLMMLMCGSLGAQAPSAATTPTTTPVQVPLTTQIKKTIGFLSSQCLHDFKTDSDSLSDDQLSKMPDAVKFATAANLITLTTRLQAVRQSMAKLTPAEAVRLKANAPLNLADQSSAIQEIHWRLLVLIKMTSLSIEDIASLTIAEADLFPVFPQDEFLGTGFFVSVPLIEIGPGDPANSKRIAVTYLVTNRHVVQPGVQHGKPCEVISSKIILNRKPDANHSADWAEVSRTDHLFKWRYSTDDSVDLAVTPIGIPDIYDVVSVPTEQFITEEDIKNKIVVEGDPVLFSGLFIQSFREVHTLEPIVRSGTLAMIPEGELQTTLNDKLGHIYLAEVHAFGGNSGSPMFIDTTRFASFLSGPSYRFLGVVSGEMLENADLTLNVTTTYTANVGANADVSIVVPAKELLSILNSAEFKVQRQMLASPINHQAVGK